MKKGEILEITGEAYQFFFKNLKNLGLLFLQGTVLVVVYSYLLYKLGVFEPKPPQEVTFTHPFLVLLLSLGYLSIFTPFVINISRSILLKQELSRDYVGSFFTLNTVKIVFYYLLIGLIFMIPLALMMFLGMTVIVGSLAMGSYGVAYFGIAVLVLAVLLLWYFYLRLSLFATLISIDQTNVLSMSMNLTKGKVFKVFVIVLLSSLPLIGVNFFGMGLDHIMNARIEHMADVPVYFVHILLTQGIVIVLTGLVSMIPMAALAFFVREQGPISSK